MFPNLHAIFFQWTRALLLLALFVMFAQPAMAQNNVRGPVAGPVPLTFSDKEGEAAQTPAGKAPAGQIQTGQAQASQVQTGKTDAAQPKFPNKDTAKNRKDYEMGTDTGTIQLGRDEATGDTVMRHNPPKKTQEPYPLEQQPIQVWPVVPGHRGR